MYINPNIILNEEKVIEFYKKNIENINKDRNI